VSRQAVGELDRKGELWLRCPHCGDSQRSAAKAHYSVNVLKGVGHCVRCGASDRLSVRQQFELLGEYGDSLPVEALQRASDVLRPDGPGDDTWLLPGPGSNRRSALARHHYQSAKALWDVFEIRDPKHNEVIGHYCRAEPKVSRIIGEKGLGWVGEDLISSIDSPLRIVEGPYDVTGGRDVCVFGFIGPSVLRSLHGHFVILVPDGDVWQDTALTKRFMGTVTAYLNSPRSAMILGLEVLPGGLDPDECPDGGNFIDRHTLATSIVNTQTKRSNQL